MVNEETKIYIPKNPLPIELTEGCPDCKYHYKLLLKLIRNLSKDKNWKITLVLTNDWAGRDSWHLDTPKVEEI